MRIAWKSSKNTGAGRQGDHRPKYLTVARNKVCQSHQELGHQSHPGFPQRLRSRVSTAASVAWTVIAALSMSHASGISPSAW
jgi:hypothetical protein